MKKEENKKYVKLGVTGVAVIVVSLICFFLLFRLPEIFGGFRAVLGILNPFMYGLIIAYILSPLCGKIEGLIRKVFRTKKGWPAGVSILLALVLAILVVAVLLLLVIPRVWDSIMGLASALYGEVYRVIQWVSTKLQDQPELQQQWNEYWNQVLARLQNLIPELQAWLQKDFIPTLQKVLGGLGSQVASILSVFKDFFLGILISIYLLGSRKKFAAQARLILYGMLPKKAAEHVEIEVRYADRMFNGFFMGKLLDSAIIGLICFVVTYLFGFKSAVLVSVIVGVTNIIPFFGPFIGAVPSALLLLLENPMHCLIFLVFIAILQQVDGNLIGPKILGNTTGLSSFWVLFSILLFGGLWGIVGMILGVPLFAVIYDIVRKVTRWGLSKHGRQDMVEKYERDYPNEDRIEVTIPEDLDDVGPEQKLVTESAKPAK